MDELHIRELLGDLDRRVHVAKRGCKDQLVALLGQIANHALGIRPLGHVLDILCFDLVAKRSEEHPSELQSLMRISYAVFCLKKKKNNTRNQHTTAIKTDHDTHILQKKEPY